MTGPGHPCPAEEAVAPVTSYVDDLAVAHRLADAADAIALARFRSLDLHVRTKPDLTPVTDADTAVERAVRGLLAADRPGDAVIGEEFGTGGGTATGRRWIIDPIDGTKNFVRGVPVWATLIALMDGPVVGCGLVSAPALGRRWWAATGQGAYAGPDEASGTPIRVSDIARLTDASFCYSSLAGWERLDRLPDMLDLMRATWRQRAYGDFFGYMLLAEGAVDIMVEPELSLWDIAALIPIVVEAGGMFTNLDGRCEPGGGSGVATNGRLHPEVLGRLGPGGASRQATAR
ncbi:MAG: histidinol-phosphatase [Dactylosporangium sp.]|nr:histidinol-phosphatase [Dactylosporangium sp.]NNJ59744.1 histidinol-phosphatase [Dactylosporangium sp.]